MGKLGRIRTIQGSTERGAGPAIAGSEGVGFSSEKPPPQAEYRPGYLESMVFAPAAQGLALGQARPLSQLRCQLPFQGSHWTVRIRPWVLRTGSAYRPHPPLRGPPSPRGRFLGFQPGVYVFARGFSAPVLRTDVFMVRLPQAIVYWNSLRGAPPLICRLRAAPSPEGKVRKLPLHSYTCS